MQIIYLNEQNLRMMQEKSKENVVALGFFDGVHKGHQRVINTASWEARRRGVDLTVMSFYPHPKVVLSGEKKKMDYIMSIKEKAKILRILGVDTLYIVEFTKKFSSLSPKNFVHDYLLNLNTVHAIAGYDFTYGKMGQGTVDNLKENANGKIDVTKVNKLEYKGHKISSTRIREVIAAGDIDQLPNLMGRLYEYEAKIEHNKLHNLTATMLPADGIYGVMLKKGNHMYHTRVQVNNANRTEITLLDKSLIEGLHGENVMITWMRKLSNPFIIFELPEVG